MAEHDDEGGTIGLDYFEEQLDPEMREIVQFVRKDLRALDLTPQGTEARGRRRRAEEAAHGARAGVLRGDDDEGFEHVVLLADTWDVTEEIIAEQAARHAAEHVDGKWTLDALRVALAKLKPGIYGGMNNGQIAAMCREAGIEVKTIRIGNTTAKGIRQADVERLMRDREGRKKGVTAR